MNQDKRLDDLFSQLKNEEPIITSNEVETILGNRIMHKTPFYKQISGAIKMNWMIPTASALAITSIMFFGDFGGDTEVSLQNNGSYTKNTEPKTLAINDDKTDNSIEITDNTYPLNTNEVPEMNGDKDLGNPSPIDPNPDTILKNTVKIDSPNLPVKGIKPITLTRNELESIGLEFYDNKISIPWCNVAIDNGCMSIELTKENVKHDLNKFLKNNNLATRYLRFISDADGNRRMSLFANENFNFTSSVNHNDSKLGKTESINIISSVNHVDTTSGTRNSIFVVQNDTIHNIVKNIRINSQEIKGNNDSSLTRYDFDISQSDGKKRDFVMKLENGVMKINDTLVLDYESIKTDPQKALQMTREMMMKNPEIMKKAMNIKLSDIDFNDSVKSKLMMNFVNTDKTKMIDNLSNDSVKFNWNDMKDMQVDWDKMKDMKIQFEQKVKVIAENVDEEKLIGLNKITPNVKFNKAIFFDMTTELNKLIPIRVSIDGSKTDYILWFELNQAFAETLPDNVKNALAPELKAVLSGDLSCGAMPETGGEPFLDVWKGCNGAIKDLSVMPNPISSVGKAKFNLIENRVVSLSIHDLFGRQKSQFVNSKTLTSGNHEFDFNVTGLEAGIYYIVINTEKGEQALQRVIVE